MLEMKSESNDDYELPAMERLQRAETCKAQGSLLSQNAAPGQDWELENFFTQGTQLSSLEVEQLTNQLGWSGADEHGAISDEKLGPLDMIFSPITIQLAPSVNDVQPSSSHSAQDQSSSLQPYAWQGSISAAADNKIRAADLVPALITKQVKDANRKSLRSKKAGLAPGPASIDTAAAAVDEEHLQRLQATINFNPKANITDLVAAYDQAAKATKGSYVAADISLPSMDHKDLRGLPSDYQRLAQTQFMQDSCRAVLRTFQAFFQSFHENVQQHQDVEWIIMVDNSGSMKNKHVQVRYGQNFLRSNHRFCFAGIFAGCCLYLLETSYGMEHSKWLRCKVDSENVMATDNLCMGPTDVSSNWTFSD